MTAMLTIFTKDLPDPLGRLLQLLPALFEILLDCSLSPLENLTLLLGAQTLQGTETREFRQVLCCGYDLRSLTHSIGKFMELARNHLAIRLLRVVDEGPQGQKFSLKILGSSNSFHGTGANAQEKSRRLSTTEGLARSRGPMSNTTDNTANYVADTLCEVRRAGTTEDGEDRLADIWVVFVTNEEGRRFRAHRVFHSDSYRTHLGEKAAAESFVLVVQNALDAGDDPAASGKWFEVDPAYGSIEYQRLDVDGHEAARERMDAELGR